MLSVSLLDIVIGSHIQQRVVVMLSRSMYLFIKSSCNFDYKSDDLQKKIKKNGLIQSREQVVQI